MTEKLNIFSFLKSATYQKNDLSEHPLFNKTYSQFMINRWLSMASDTNCLTYANYLSTKDMSKLAHYKFLLYTLPKKYVKFNYQKGKEDRKEEVEIIQKHYKMSKEKCLEILEILSDEQFESIKKKYDRKGK